MKKTITLFVLFFVAIIFVVSCRRDKHIADVCFQTDILPVFINKCSNPGCHNPTDKIAGYDFTNYEGIMKGINVNHANRSDIFLNIKGKNPSMPPKTHTALTDKEIDYIKYWINFGAENTSCVSSTCDTLSYISYLTSIKSIIDQNCIGCHRTSFNTSQDLDTYNGVKTSVTGGKFIPAINHTGSNPMPQGGNKLQNCDLRKIDKWIADGMPE